MRQPYATELIHDSDFEELVTGIGKRPGMYVGAYTLEAVCSYLVGYDEALLNAPLLGFHQWLVVQLRTGNNVAWPGLIRHFIPPKSDTDDDAVEKARIEAACNLIVQFLRFRRQYGLTKIFYEYGKWLLRQKWYDGPLRKKDGK